MKKTEAVYVKFLWTIPVVMALVACGSEPDVAADQRQRIEAVFSQAAKDYACEYPAEYGDVSAYDYASYHPEYAYYDEKYNLTDAERRGRDTWYLWTGCNEKLWRAVSMVSEEKFGFRIDFMQMLDTTQFSRAQRWDLLGAMNDPLCQPATEPDEYGLWLDRCESEGAPGIPTEPTGIVGMRKRKNPKFDPAKWDPVKYWEDPTIEPPYLVGISCGVCHIAFDPLNPPEDAHSPKWSNLAGAIGNQYLQEGKLFTLGLTPDDFRWHVAHTQQAGTSETSRLATDHINNPNAINSIFQLKHRPSHDDVILPEIQKAVGWRPGDPLHYILKDGADSVGIPGASLRVYANIGMCGDYWVTRHDLVDGRTPQKPFDVAQVTDPNSAVYCQDWVETGKRMADAAAFLQSIKPMYLKDADGGKGAHYITTDEAVLKRGKLAFADNCAECHSSKRPPEGLSGQARKQWFRESVLSEDFLVDNYLSDDERHPITQIGTNAARALATNAIQGHVWEQLSSETYKGLPSAGTIEVVSPFNPKKTRKFELPDGGRGYYRTPTLVSIWATAPFFHNNSLGIYNKDPSVRGRVLAFEDAMKKLLWPELREYQIKRTTMDSYLKLPETESRTRGIPRLKDKIRAAVRDKLIPEEGLSIPAGTPINLIANINVEAISLPKVAKGIVRSLRGEVPGELLTNYDFVENKGHRHAGPNLSDEDKRALLEFVKTF